MFNKRNPMKRRIRKLSCERSETDEESNKVRVVKGEMKE
jgi:hypothetical protein